MRSVASLHALLAYTWRGVAVIATLLAAGNAVASDGAPFHQSGLDVTLGVYFDAAGTVCSGTITPGTPATVYIVGHSAPGTEIISGAEFRFTGLPPSWTVYAIPNPQCLNIGDPFGAGANIAATRTQCDPQWSTFLMYTVLVLATTDVEDVRFELTKRQPPLNPILQCPLVTDCGGIYGYMEMHCVQTSPCFVNTTKPAPCEKPTAVQEFTWSEIREMYR